MVYLIYVIQGELSKISACNTLKSFHIGEEESTQIKSIFMYREKSVLRLPLHKTATTVSMLLKATHANTHSKKM